uniref:Uncharacterized protein n=1 Tax=Anopheles maculatus TaxID=74869 RepID=A0A182SDW3_9DIPT
MEEQRRLRSTARAVSTDCRSTIIAKPTTVAKVVVERLSSVRPTVSPSMTTGDLRAALSDMRLLLEETKARNEQLTSELSQLRTLLREQQEQSAAREAAAREENSRIWEEHRKDREALNELLRIMTASHGQQLLPSQMQQPVLSQGYYGVLAQDEDPSYAEVVRRKNRGRGGAGTSQQHHHTAIAAKQQLQHHQRQQKVAQKQQQQQKQQQASQQQQAPQQQQQASQ